jgi:uncharacterized membrane protein YfcA
MSREELAAELARREAAEAGERARAEAAKAAQPPTPQQAQEWIRQNNIANAGLLGAAFIMVEGFLTARSLDVSGKICVVAFAVAIPLLAALLLVGQQEVFKRHSTESVLVKVAKAVAMASFFVGIVAGFWHITWIAGVAMLATAIVAMGVHSAGYSRLERQASGAGGS